ncbi:MAG: ferric reductase-like transmembrane domain-containing protein [Caldilineales bacterium]|nr:ferric reductase-like transmembrane domain-containing protein [Caldilineales bacterium]
MPSLTSPSTTTSLDRAFVPWKAALAIVGAAVAGAILAVWLLPWLAPSGQTGLLSSQTPWHLTRVTGVVGYLLLWLSMALGISISGRLARLWPGGPTAFDLHQFSSLLALAFSAFHGLILLGDSYISYTLSQILIPFASSEYHPLATGLGQIAVYLALAASFSFYIRKRIGQRAWRLLHFTTFVAFFLTTLHGALAGTDTAVLLPLYIAASLSILFLTLYRIFITLPAAART